MYSTPALLTDRYELTMLSAALADGTAHHKAVFEVFTRSLPTGRGYGVVAGTGRVLDAVQNFRFTSEQLDYLVAADAIDEATRTYLTDWSFTGKISGYREGELFFPLSPVLTVEATFGDAVILETLVLSILNHDSAVASAASRMVSAAQGRPLIEMGSRRTHELAAPSAARAAYITGFFSTSNLQAGMQWGIPTVGTSAHAFTLSHASEVDAFASQVKQLGTGTSLLVDTYNIPQGIRNAIEVAGPQLGAIRLDSGDPAEQAKAARSLLDELGATDTKVVSTGDLDEFAIERLAASPVDVYGVGTKLVTGSGHPTAGFVYKLVAIETVPGGSMRPVAKKATGKASVGGRKYAVRETNEQGRAVAEKVFLDAQQLGQAAGRPLQVEMLLSGVRLHDPSLAEIRDFHTQVKSQLTADALSLQANHPAMAAELVHVTV